MIDRSSLFHTLVFAFTTAVLASGLGACSATPSSETTANAPAAEEPTGDAEEGLAIPRCQGYRTPCSLLSRYACSSGCSWAQSCEGTANSCGMMMSADACGRHKGCFWNDGSCMGVATSCSQLTAYACSAQTGCRTTEACTGYGTPCSSLLSGQCMSAQGCFLH